MMRIFISSVALFVNVTASMRSKPNGETISRLMYSVASRKVFPEPAEALYTVSNVSVIYVIRYGLFHRMQCGAHGSGKFRMVWHMELHSVYLLHDAEYCLALWQ